jgi:hypothetical protein
MAKDKFNGLAGIALPLKESVTGLEGEILIDHQHSCVNTPNVAFAHLAQAEREIPPVIFILKTSFPPAHSRAINKENAPGYWYRITRGMVEVNPTSLP